FCIQLGFACLEVRFVLLSRFAFFLKVSAESANLFVVVAGFPCRVRLDFGIGLLLAGVLLLLACVFIPPIVAGGTACVLVNDVCLSLGCHDYSLLTRMETGMACSLLRVPFH